MMHATLIPLEATHPLRLAVLRPGGTLADCHFPSDTVPGGFHVGTFLAGRCVAVGSFGPERHPALEAAVPYRLRGMASAADVRGKGCGRMLLALALEELSRRGADLLWCNAREGAIPFYQRMGFAGQGPLFDIAGIGPHQVMHRPIGPVG
jgi:GNAT superfamily N-acetyltransferase